MHINTRFWVLLTWKLDCTEIVWNTIRTVPQNLKIAEKPKTLCGLVETFGKRNSADRLSPRNDFSVFFCFSVEKVDKFMCCDLAGSVRSKQH